MAVGVWAAPAIMVAAATPALAASGPPGTMPIASLTLQQYGASAQGPGGRGPITVSGGRIGNSSSASGTVTYILTVTKPGGQTETLITTTLNVTAYNGAEFPTMSYGNGSLPSGTYLFTHWVIGADGTKSVNTNTVTIP